LGSDVLTAALLATVFLAVVLGAAFLGAVLVTVLTAGLFGATGFLAAVFDLVALEGFFGATGFFGAEGLVAVVLFVVVARVLGICLLFLVFAFLAVVLNLVVDVLFAIP